MIGDEIANNQSSDDESCNDSDVMVEFEDEIIVPDTTKKVLSKVTSTEKEKMSEEEENSSAEEENSADEENSSAEEENTTAEEESSSEEEEESSSINQNLEVYISILLILKLFICLNLTNENKILYSHYI